MRVDVLGVGFDDLDLTAAVDRILERLDRGERTFLITANPEFVMLARRDDELAHIAREADLVVPDGTGVAVASSLLGSAIPRVPGRLLVDALVPLLAERGATLFLLGAAPGVAERAAETLRRRVPDVRIAGSYAGSADDHGDTASRVRAAAPSVVLVAFGMPKQEQWIARNLDALPSVRLAIGVGGVFDQLAGVRKVPPALVHRLGLEWLWRLIREPWRWRRQRVLPLFVALVLRKRMTGR
ncbi:MAG: WecB/TagA/CpsF family glycosyltransferase [Chloroflexi bacterium]|nr:MAG: WecB/TagA/CpsF family glycosyltransferase [Chloroflexota bacterium]TMC30655.1 MAG: WecB/TagA/CpsF family glycosyltransferase [Chloroflexota bacterium]TMC33335.1 MAG: WecB/TagA/CpsF family glycosyltransferase [Chloroflexota bacterium]TMC58785.1 MAG: WecB/TagA/CpsF family glycosyltransferase [Chloroflexota bacterium]